MERSFAETIDNGLRSVIGTEGKIEDANKGFTSVEGIQSESVSIPVNAIIPRVDLNDMTMATLFNAYRVYIANLKEGIEDNQVRELNAVTKTVAWLLGIVEKVNNSIVVTVSNSEKTSVISRTGNDEFVKSWDSFLKSYKNLAPSSVTLLFLTADQWYKTNHSVGGFRGNLQRPFATTLAGTGVIGSKRLVYDLCHFASKRNMLAILMSINGREKPIVSNNICSLSVKAPELGIFETIRVTGVPSGQAILGLCNQFLNDLSLTGLVAVYPKVSMLRKAVIDYKKVVEDPLAYHPGVAYLYSKCPIEVKREKIAKSQVNDLTPGKSKTKYSSMLGDMNEFYEKLFIDHTMLRSPMVSNSAVIPGFWKSIVNGYKSALRDLVIDDIDFSNMIKSGGNFDLINELLDIVLEREATGENEEENEL